MGDTNPTAQCKMDAFKGKYERTWADQYDEFMKVLGVGMLLRKAATCSMPVVEITESAGVWSIKSSTTLKTIELKFKLNEEFEDGKIVCVQKAVKEGQKSTKSIRELVGNELVYTMTVDGVPDLLCVQKFKRVA